MDRVTSQELRDAMRWTNESDIADLLEATADTLDDLDKDIAVLEETVFHLEFLLDSTG